MITPFNRNFHHQQYDITPSILQQGYIIFENIPDLSTVTMDLGEGNSVLADAYIVEEVTLYNSFLYPNVDIGSYILTWNNQFESSSSSSSSYSELELKNLLESGDYSLFQVRYISTS